MLHRREFILSGLAAIAAPAAVRGALGAPRAAAKSEPGNRLAAIERGVAGRLGVEVFDVGSGHRISYRENERFPMCSTFKWLLVTQVLSRVDRGDEQLARRIAYGPSDLLEYAPVAREHVDEGGMSVSALCEAAIEHSDNTAANLLLATVGGPSGLTAYLRGLGDSVTRFDRSEPELNTSSPGDPRDTTSPGAMVANLRRVLLGQVLTGASRDRLTAWMVGNTTGAAKLRAGLPATWRVGDKTGMGANGSTNDVAIVWPTGKGPLLIAAYLTESTAPTPARNGALAEIGRVIAEWAAG